MAHSIGLMKEVSYDFFFPSQEPRKNLQLCAPTEVHRMNGSHMTNAQDTPERRVTAQKYLLMFTTRLVSCLKSARKENLTANVAVHTKHRNVCVYGSNSLIIWLSVAWSS